MPLTRQSFLNTSLFGIASMLIPGPVLQAFEKREKGPQLTAERVREFVGVAHKDMAKVKQMLVADPDLLNSVHNLGGWDWEDALGAAGHTGNTELAEFLLAKGARPTVCVFAMLGRTDIVRAMITGYPCLKDAKGPHDISLLRHALAGGVPAEKTAAW